MWLALGLSLPFIALGLWIGLSLNEPVHRFLHDFRDEYTAAQSSLILFGRYLGWLVLTLAFVQVILLIVCISHNEPSRGAACALQRPRTFGDWGDRMDVADGTFGVTDARPARLISRRF